MATSIFDEKLKMPEDIDVAAALGDLKQLWDELETHIYQNYEGIAKTWKFYSKKSGWTLVFKQKDRALIYFIPCKDYFKVSLVFSKKAVDAAKQAPLPAHVIDAVVEATAYVEGTSFFVDIKDSADLECVFTLLKIKNAS